MEHNGNNNGSADNKDVIYLMGGVALMVLGAGLVLTNSSVRNTLTSTVSALLPDLQQGNLLSDLTGVGPDIERYMRLRSM
ncbi:MAG: hypothetical protein HYR56_13720 [Acidobacteria bacterium]|nr:hypothetical protein [Acidobacteriota bacterium]MBI3423959.1 hypothetical protein [Acidobacteriota bacterium]